MDAVTRKVSVVFFLAGPLPLLSDLFLGRWSCHPRREKGRRERQEREKGRRERREEGRKGERKRRKESVFVSHGSHPRSVHIS